MSQNNENSGMMFALALVCTMAVFLLVVVYAIGVFISAGLTILALCAWNKPLTTGKHTLTPEEARPFVYRGLVGMVVAPVFIIFLELMFQLRINGDYLPHIIIGGYVLGSLGIQILIEQEREANKAAQSEIIPPHVFTQPPEPPAMPRPERPPFEYASWDDEEAGR